VEGEVLREI
jgi:predicted ATP-binding protein involved in virulence